MSVQAARQTSVDAMIERLLSVNDAKARQELVTKDPALDWKEIIRILSERVWQEVRVDTRAAERIADAAINVAEAVNDPASLGRSLRAKANALYALDRHSAAIELHEQAIRAFQKAGDEAELARTLSGSIQPLLLLGRYEHALSHGEQAREIFQRQGNAHRLARVEINIGNIYHRQDRFTEALAFYERAYQELLKYDDAEGLAAVLSNLSLCYISLNEFSKALELHQMARLHCDAKGMPILVAYADYNIAYLYFLRGEYGRAIKMLRDAAVSAKKADDSYQSALCNLDLSEIYLELNLNAEAGELGRTAHQQFEHLGFGYESAKALAFAAIAASRAGQPFEAVKLFSQAREMFVRDKNQVWPSLIDLYQALVLFNEGRLFEARRLCLAAYEFFGNSALRRKGIFAELLLARIALRMNDQKTAEQYCERAVKELPPLNSPVLSYQAEFLMGEIQRASGQDQQAYRSYCNAREYVERLRGSLRGEELKIAFFQNKLEVYENLIELCLRGSGNQEEAFAYIELAKSRALMDLLSHSMRFASPSDSGQSELVRTIRNVREELNWYYNLIEREQLRPEERSQERIRHLEQQAREREAALMRAAKEASITEAGEAGLQIASAMSLEQIRAALPADTAMVEYFRVQDRYLACVLTAGQLEIIPITVNSRLQKLLQLLQFQISKFRLDPKYVETFGESLLRTTEAHLKSLFVELLAPIHGRLDVEHLVFVPHGLLHYVPFHALHDGNSYLIDRFSVSYAPSATIYAMGKSKPAAELEDALVLGVPDALAPSIQAEVQAISGLLPGSRLFLGENATENVLRQYGPRSRFIHIATHGYFRQDNPMFSSIRLGDSHLSVYDLYHMRLPAEMVVLSGCATGMNAVMPGDELLGLVRGLLHTGAQSVVLSLWDVHDGS
ncbi:MAG TPA: CHAT domain-containing tetratricopeptide repeat protein, partial [Terriglobales bacterium]